MIELIGDDSIKEEFRSVLLGVNSSWIIGRNELLIKNSQISRNQVEITCLGKLIAIKQLGINPGIIVRDGESSPMVRGNSYQLFPGDSFTLLLEKYKFCVSGSGDKVKMKRNNKEKGEEEGEKIEKKKEIGKANQKDEKIKEMLKMKEKEEMIKELQKQKEMKEKEEKRILKMKEKEEQELLKMKEQEERMKELQKQKKKEEKVQKQKEKEERILLLQKMKEKEQEEKMKELHKIKQKEEKMIQNQKEKENKIKILPKQKDKEEKEPKSKEEVKVKDTQKQKEKEKEKESLKQMDKMKEIDHKAEKTDLFHIKGKPKEKAIYSKLFLNEEDDEQEDHNKLFTIKSTVKASEPKFKLYHSFLDSAEETENISQTKPNENNPTKTNPLEAERLYNLNKKAKEKEKTKEREDINDKPKPPSTEQTTQKSTKKLIIAPKGILATQNNNPKEKEKEKEKEPPKAKPDPPNPVNSKKRIFSETEMPDKPACILGDMCPKKKPSHLQKYSHPTIKKPKIEDDDVDLFAPHKTKTNITKPKTSNQLMELVLEQDELHKDQHLSNKQPNAQDTAALKKNEVTRSTDSISNFQAISKELTEAINFPRIPPETDGIGSLAFPAIGTDFYNFDPKKAAKIMCKEIYSFLSSVQDPDIQLVLVEKKGSPVLKALPQFFNSAERRFNIFSSSSPDITHLDPPCCYIVNETNWRMKASYPPLNKKLHQLAGSEFTTQTKKQFNTAKIGGAYPISVPPDSPLRAHSIFYVIHVLPPNLNPKKPDCLTDTQEAKKLLAQTFKNTLDCFYQLYQRNKPS